jgi:predicted amidohydrolase YtcJ
MVNHVSMHGAVLNSAAFKEYGISAGTKTPAGGIILRQKGSNEKVVETIKEGKTIYKAN